MIRSRSRVASPTTALVSLVALLLVALIVLQPPSYTRGQPGDPQNPDPEGTMALAEVLRSRGVVLKIARSVSTAIATPADTLVISHPHDLTAHQLEALSQVEADVVLIGVTRSLPSFLPEVDSHGSSAQNPVPAGCEDPRAGAGPIDSIGPLLSAPDTTACFPGGDSGMVLTRALPNGRSVTVLPADALRNSHITAEANAALTLRVLGEGERLTWLVGSRGDPYGLEGAAEDFSLTWLWTALGAMMLALIWWRAPRFGRLISEPLPVIVNASETTVGRGNLYRRAKDTSHAATALRLGVLTRISHRLGLPSHAERSEVVTRVAQAARLPESQVFSLFYGPAPDGPESLHALALSLDALEDEVSQL